MSSRGEAEQTGLAGWFGRSLRRKLTGILLLSLALASAVFLVLLLGFYQDSLRAERGAAARQVYQLFRATLENAMLKRDIEGLREIVDRLGEQEDIERVMILAPSGEVRFSSDHRLIGDAFDLAGGELCEGCGLEHGAVDVRMALRRSDAGEEVLRNVVPVANQQRCGACHGDVAANPVNGILVVDYRAVDARETAMHGALFMAGAGFVVTLIGAASLWFGLERWLFRPLSALSNGAARLGRGELDQRIDVRGADEIAGLGHRFNDMAGRIGSQMDELRHRETFLQALIDAIPDGIRVIGPDYRVERVNRAFLRQQGLEPGEAVGAPCYRSSHAIDRPCAPTLVTCPLRELSGDSNGITCRHRHVRKDGSELFVEVSAAAFDVGSGEGTRRLVIESIRDLSGDIHLSHEQKLSELGMLAAGVAHEVHNPLSSIRIALHALRNDKAGRIDRDAYLELMDEEIEKCIDISRRLLKLSMPRRDVDGLVEMAELVPEVISLLQAEAEGRELAVETRLDGRLAIIGSDSEMRMLVLNLAQNAFHAMAPGGHLVIRGSREGGYVRLEFTDDGCGIDAGNLERIFHPFWSRRADRADRSGTGLGLSICRAIVQSHAGRIEVTSKVGTGTTFVVFLPSAEEE